MSRRDGLRAAWSAGLISVVLLTPACDVPLVQASVPVLNVINPGKVKWEPVPLLAAWVPTVTFPIVKLVSSAGPRIFVDSIQIVDATDPDSLGDPVLFSVNSAASGDIVLALPSTFGAAVFNPPPQPTAISLTFATPSSQLRVFEYTALWKNTLGQSNFTAAKAIKPAATRGDIANPTGKGIFNILWGGAAAP